MLLAIMIGCKLTASEPLTLDEEYAMQKSWQDDPKKCTFIVLSNKGGSSLSEIEDMIGDVNLFLNDFDDPCRAEIDVMIAEKSNRNSGCGTEAVLMMMHYGASVLGIRSFYCKIHETNEPSLKLFRRLGFSEVKFVEAFKEYEFEFQVDDFESFVANLFSFQVTYGTYNED